MTAAASAQQATPIDPTACLGGIAALLDSDQRWENGELILRIPSPERWNPDESIPKLLAAENWPQDDLIKELLHHVVIDGIEKTVCRVKDNL